MPWKLEHKCHIADADADTKPYGMLRLTNPDSGQQVTKAVCPNCREELVFLGQEPFGEAQAIDTSTGLPPGFLLPRSRTQA